MNSFGLDSTSMSRHGQEVGEDTYDIMIEGYKSPNVVAKLDKTGEMHTFTTLPVELLYEIQLFAASSTLPVTCKALHCIFASSPPSYRAQYLVACTDTPHIRQDVALTKILRYPICTKDVLEAYFRRRHAEGTRSAPAPAPELPKRLFRALVRKSTRDWTDRDPPLPFLRCLYNCPHLSSPNVNSHEGYALAKAVHAGFVPLVRFLLDHGAEPSWKGNLAINIAIHRKDLRLVKMLVERMDTQKSPSQNGKRQKLEDRVDVTPGMLRIAVKCKAEDIVEYLTRDKGCIPDMQTLLLMQ